MGWVGWMSMSMREESGERAAAVGVGCRVSPARWGCICVPCCLCCGCALVIFYSSSSCLSVEVLLVLRAPFVGGRGVVDVLLFRRECSVSGSKEGACRLLPLGARRGLSFWSARRYEPTPATGLLATVVLAFGVGCPNPPPCCCAASFEVLG